MAFSFRIGTKWCHDFPKLARESGFYFNMHKSRVRVDWNRISNVDIDRIIRERDFYTIDDNVNSVIDYCLESEYDVKILDPNFVKLFRLAQLAVEYLLYCKQYLDHSVVILKDELRLKIEENVKLKKEIVTLEEVIKHLKEKSKERSKLIETKIDDCSGEIYKCPYCPKTFISSVFLNAHVMRRHTYTPDLYVTSSPVHEHYRNETEKLHNEIKSLKERLNETERVIRNESDKVSDKKTVDYDRRLSQNEVESFKCDTNKMKEQQEYKGYREEIKNLKTMLFDEIHNLRQKEKTMHEHTSETNVQTLINQQEKEFQKLRNQLFEKLTPDIESMHAKLYAQENYWKSKIEHLEKQHEKDVERLTTELKLTQKAADDIKAEYESKVNNLERQTANQSNILIEQSKQLHSLSHEINVSLLNEKNKTPESNLQKDNDQVAVLNQSDEAAKQSDESDLKQNDQKQTYLNAENIDKEFSSDLFVSKILPLTTQHKISRNIHTLSSDKTVTNESKKNTRHKNTRIVKNTKVKNKKKVEKDLQYCSLSNTSESQDSLFERGLSHEIKHRKYDFNDQFILKADSNESDMNELKNAAGESTSRKPLSTKNRKESEHVEDDLISETNSESIISESQTHSETESNTIIQNNFPAHEYKNTAHCNSFYKKLRRNLLDTFDQKLRDLGIDPEWHGIPTQTFKQKMDILKHHQKINMKKLPKYHQIKLKIMEEVLNKISNKAKIVKSPKHVKKSTTIKAFGDKKNSNYTSALRVQNITPNKLYSTPERYNYTRSSNELELTPIKSIKTLNHKSIENLLQTSSNSITSLEDIGPTTNVQGISKRDSLDKMKSFFENDATDNSNVQNISMSPKHSKSVLKSTTGSASSLIKKKVIFDLAEEKDTESLSEHYIKKEELNNSNWSSSSASNEKRYLSERDNDKNTSNIILKTTQSDKIAEISKKLEIQLSMARKKPTGAVETIFSSKRAEDTENQQISTSSISSLLESSLKVPTLNSKVTNSSLPQPAPRNLKDKTSEILHTESISEISDLDSDIDKILKLE
ncbi:DAZ interacting zinc finger protein 1 isoform X2 [Calliopsis andreniformis]|uniref:DAZ interacting zinc finger protein 1 isoform X2 n=1 Tax=Calliopsis andreniformis TaxID=337506 RepID=UPI003FCCCB4F